MTYPGTERLMAGKCRVLEEACRQGFAARALCRADYGSCIPRVRTAIHAVKAIHVATTFLCRQFTGTCADELGMISTPASRARG
jgi:hypothetical protein